MSRQKTASSARKSTTKLNTAALHAAHYFPADYGVTDDFFTGLGGGGGVVGETGFVDAGGQSSGGYMQEPQQQQTYGGDQYGVLVDDGDAQYGSMSMPMQDAADAQQYGSMPEPGYGGDPEVGMWGKKKESRTKCPWLRYLDRWTVGYAREGSREGRV